MFTKIKTAQEIEKMRKGGKILGETLKILRAKAQPGITTKQLADVAASHLKQHGVKPAFLGYQNYPDVLCISVNDEVVHGIPKDNLVLQEGDVVGLDFGVLLGGMVTDAAISVIVGKPLSKIDDNLLNTTNKAMYAGIEQVKDGAHVGDIGYAIQKVLDKAGFGIVRDLVGHGVGHELHEEPNIPNFGLNGTGPVLKAGMTIAIEPMATIGDYRVFIDNDGWTVRTIDGSRAAHFEHTVLVTADGYEILTEA